MSGGCGTYGAMVVDSEEHALDSRGMVDHAVHHLVKVGHAIPALSFVIKLDGADVE